MSEGSAPVGSSSGGGGGVARWSLGLEQLLADPAGAAAFAHFLSKEFAAENIRYASRRLQFYSYTLRAITCYTNIARTRRYS